jgi:hypothetical protein
MPVIHKADNTTNLKCLLSRRTNRVDMTAGLLFKLLVPDAPAGDKLTGERVRSKPNRSVEYQ